MALSRKGVSNRKRRKSRTTKIFAFLLTNIIIAMLIFSGPADAFTLDLDLNKDEVKKGDKVKFTTTIKINSNEHLPIDYLILELDGPEKVQCLFNAYGEPQLGCKGITIELTNDSNFVFDNNGRGYWHGYGYNFGYGYGYAEGELTYKITLDTDDYKIGRYETKIKLNIADKTFVKPGPDLVIKRDGKDLTSRSSRGCLTSWTCGQWSECIGGLEYRKCVNQNTGCHTEKKPVDIRTCDTVIRRGLDSGLINLNNNKEDQKTASFNFNNLDNYLNSPQLALLLVLLIADMGLLITVVAVDKSGYY